MELYKKHVDENGIFHLGDKPYSVIVDINDDGIIEVNIDEELIEAYGKGNSNDDDSNDNKARNIFIGSQTTRIDEKPMGINGTLV